MNGGPITILPIMTTKHVSLTFFLINKRVIVIIGIFTHLCACLSQEFRSGHHDQCQLALVRQTP